MPGLASIKGTRIEELKTKERLPEGPVKEEKKPTKFTNIRESSTSKTERPEDNKLKQYL